MKTHIMRLAPQDLRTSSIRKRAVRLGRRDLWFLYQELLWALHEGGGELPSDPEALADEVELFSPEEIRAALPLLAPVAGKKGGIVVDGRRIFCQRVSEELADEKAFSQDQALRGKRGGLARARAIRIADGIKEDSDRQANAKRSPSKRIARRRRSPSPSPYPSPSPTPTPETDHGAVLGFYNRLTGRKLTVEGHEKFIRLRLNEGATVQTLKLAVIGACLKQFHLGFNDRKAEYLDPETIFRPGRLDGHAEHARRATFRLAGAEEVWRYWMQALEKSRGDVMRHFFSARDELLVEEGGKPLGPAAAFGSDFKPHESWPESA